jgi:integrase
LPFELARVLYATGLRRAELCHRKITDIDSERMVIHAHQREGSRDRDVLLTPKLQSLAERLVARSPDDWPSLSATLPELPTDASVYPLPTAPSVPGPRFKHFLIDETPSRRSSCFAFVEVSPAEL